MGTVLGGEWRFPAPHRCFGVRCREHRSAGPETELGYPGSWSFNLEAVGVTR